MSIFLRGISPWLLLLLVLAPIAAMPAPTPSPLPSDMHSLIVYGHGWWFIAREPDGWLGSTEGSSSVGSNLYFLRPDEALDHYRTLIRVTILPKDFGEAVDRDLAADMARSKRDVPRMTFSNLRVTHPYYAVYARIYRVGDGGEYVTYLNPGKAAGYFFIVVMSPPDNESPTGNELIAYQSVITHLVFAGTTINR